MTPTDSSALIGLLDRSDANHWRCLLAYGDLSTPLIVTYAGFAEAEHLLNENRHYGNATLRQALWNLLRNNDLVLHTPESEEAHSCLDLIDKYDYCDMADASIVVAAERVGASEIFALDGHFYTYQTSKGEHFQVTPGPRKGTL